MEKAVFEKKLEKALKLAPPDVFEMTANLYFVPTFCGDHSFFYKHEGFDGGEKIHKYMLVDMEKGQSEPLFDHIILAKRLSDMFEKEISHKKLPLENIKKTEKGIEFEYQKSLFSFDGVHLEKLCDMPVQRRVTTKDGRFSAYTQNDNIYITDNENHTDYPITHDGIPHYGYGGVFEGNESIIKEKLEGFVRPAGVIWAPDNRRFLTYRIDEREVKELHLIQNVVDENNMRPVHHAYKYALPGDEAVATAELYLCDAVTKECVKVMDGFTVDLSEPFNGGFKIAAWSDEGNKFIVWRMARGHNKAEVFAVDADTKEVKKIFDEVTDTFLFFDFYRSKFGFDPRFDKNAGRQMWYSEKYNRLLWISERDGHFHIYDYDVENLTLRKQITKGEYNIRQILRVDDENKKIYLTAAGYEEGSSPYKMKLYCCNTETGELTLITPDEHEHYVNISPDGKFLVDNYSTFDEPPMVVLRTIEGKYIATVLKADITPLDKMGIAYPMPFIEKGADGVTDVYGLLLMPYDFDPNKKFPIMDYYYGGNQTTNVPTNFHDYLNKGYLNSFSELGFAVVVIDGHGTPFRSKAYHDDCHKNVGECCGMRDHVAVINNLCDKFSFMDRDRVCVWGHSGGGFAAYKCMVNYPDFYKCAMASGGNHMQELYISGWSERFMNDYDREIWRKNNSEFDADKLKGPILLIHGEIDDNVHPASTMRIVNALIKADKDFDFLIMPNKHHLLSVDKYYQKKVFSFFAKHML